MMRKKFATVCVLAFFAVTLLAMPFVWVKQRQAAFEENEQYANIDWQSLYPYEDDASVSPAPEKKTAVSKALEQYQYLSTSITSKLEKRAPELVFCRQPAIEGYGLLNKLIGLRIIKDANDTTLLLQNGYLTGKETEQWDTETSANNLTAFSEWVTEQGIGFLYIMCPTKILSDEDVIPGVIENFGSNAKDRIIETVTAKGVPTLDLREMMPKDYSAYMNLFYRTDHHWKTQTGLWAASILAEKLNDNYGFNIDLENFAEEQYTLKKYPNLFLGSLGKKVSKSYSEPDDFDLLIPKYRCDIHMEVPNIGVFEDGDFMAMIDEYKLSYGNEYNLNPYGALAYGDKPLIQIKNSACTDGKKILIVKDSFADAVTPYIAANCSQVDTVDLRQFDGSIKGLILQNRYDMVIVMMRSSGMIKNTDSTENKLWIYR